MLTNRTSGFWNAVRLRGGEVGVAGADADHHVGVAGRSRWPPWCRSSRSRPGTAGGRRPACPCRPGSGRPGCRSPRTNAASASVGAGVVHATAGHDQRLLRRSDQLGGRLQDRRAPAAAGRRARPACSNSATGQSYASRLHVLREAHRHRAGLGRVGQHPHRRQQRGRQLLGPPDPVEVLRHRPEARR